MLQSVLDNCIEWQNDACSTLHAVACFLNTEITHNEIASGLLSKVEQQVTGMESIIKAGLSLGLDFSEIPRLEDASSTLRWCFKALSFCSVVPQLEVLLFTLNKSQLLLRLMVFFLLSLQGRVIEFSLFSRC